MKSARSVKTGQLALLDIIQKDNHVNASTRHLMASLNWDQPRFRVIVLANARRVQARVCFGWRKECLASSPAVFLAPGCQRSICLARSRNASLSSPTRNETVSPSSRSGIRSSWRKRPEMMFCESVNNSFVIGKPSNTSIVKEWPTEVLLRSLAYSVIFSSDGFRP